MGSRTCSDLRDSGLGQSCVFTLRAACEELSQAPPQGRGWDRPPAGAACGARGGVLEPCPPASASSSTKRGIQKGPSAKWILAFSPALSRPLLLLSVFHAGFPGGGLFEKGAPQP